MIFFGKREGLQLPKLRQAIVIVNYKKIKSPMEKRYKFPGFAVAMFATQKMAGGNGNIVLNKSMRYSGR